VITPKRFSEALGLWAGSLIAPLFAVGTLLRQDQVFHPRGIYFRAEVKPAENVSEEFTALADSLSQAEALVRMSPGTWRGEKGLLPDVLGMAIRFSADPALEYQPRDGSSDLLLITSRRMSTILLSMLSTNQRDFLDNTYHGAANFEIEGHPYMHLRLVPITKAETESPNRFDKLREAVTEGEAGFRLFIDAPWDPSLSTPLVEIRLLEEVAVNEDQMKFWPFDERQQIRPMGFVQWTRPVPYLLSQWARKAM
jgi:hypothetical protein